MSKSWGLSLWAAACSSACQPTIEPDAAALGGTVSTSLCGDGYAVAGGLLASGEVSALSWQSRDALSPAPDNGLPQAWNDPEVLAALAPDRVIAGPGDRLVTDADVLVLDWVEDVEGVRANAAMLGVDLNLEDRLVQLDALRPSRPPRILYLSRAGGTAGPNTYVDAAIRLAGGTNVITAPGWQTPDVEALIATEPDLVVTSFFADGYESVQAAGLRNRALRRHIDARPQVEVPGRLWPCAGPGLVEAAEIIQGAVRNL